MSEFYKFVEMLKGAFEPHIHEALLEKAKGYENQKSFGPEVQNSAQTNVNMDMRPQQPFASPAHPKEPRDCSNFSGKKASDGG